MSTTQLPPLPHPNTGRANHVKEYTVTINGVPHTFLLSEDDAKRLRVKEKAAPEKKAATPANKSRSTTTK